MNQWNIDVYGVSLVLTDLSDQLGIDGGGFSDTIDSTVDGLQMALTNVKSPPVESALSEFMGHFTTDTDAMFTRTLSCLHGVNEATLAYNQGQVEMAAEAQRQAGTTENLDLSPPPPTEGPR